MRIKLDENLPAQLVTVLTELGHDVDTVASHQARDLLGRLVGRGKLVLKGATNGAFYERPS